MKPIIGGPIKNPTYPISEIVEIATPIGIEVICEESKKVMGMMQETPNPTNTNPTTIKAGCVKMIAIKKPTDKNSELSSMMAYSPNLAVNLSPTNRPINIVVK